MADETLDPDIAARCNREAEALHTYLLGRIQAGHNTAAWTPSVLMRVLLVLLEAAPEDLRLQYLEAFVVALGTRFGTVRVVTSVDPEGQVH